MKHLSIKILGKEYKITCSSGQESQLQQAACYLDQKMTEVRSRGRIINFEGILVTVAINMAHELLLQTESFTHNIAELEKKLNNVLQNNSISNLSSNNLQFEYNNN